MLPMNKRLFLLGASLLLASVAGAQSKGKPWKKLSPALTTTSSPAVTWIDAEAELRDEIRQGCNACTPAQLQERFAAQEKDLLRDLIDNSLLVQRAKDMGHQRGYGGRQAPGRDPPAK